MKFYNPLRNLEPGFNPALSPVYGINTKAYKAQDFLASRAGRAIISDAHQVSNVQISTLVNIYLQLCLSSHNNITTLIGQQKLADKCGCSKSTITRAIAALRKVGGIFVEHRYTKIKETRRRTTSKITFTAFKNWITSKFSQLKNSTFFASSYPSGHGDNAVVLNTVTGEILGEISAKKRPKRPRR